MNFQDEIEVQCPYCGEWNNLLVDSSSGAQSYIEDCQVCCQPMQIRVDVAEDSSPTVTVQRDDE